MIAVHSPRHLPLPPAPSPPLPLSPPHPLTPQASSSSVHHQAFSHVANFAGISILQPTSSCLLTSTRTSKDSLMRNVRSHRINARFDLNIFLSTSSTLRHNKLITINDFNIPRLIPLGHLHSRMHLPIKCVHFEP